MPIHTFVFWGAGEGKGLVSLAYIYIRLVQDSAPIRYCLHLADQKMLTLRLCIAWVLPGKLE